MSNYAEDILSAKIESVEDGTPKTEKRGRPETGPSRVKFEKAVKAFQAGEDSLPGWVKFTSASVGEDGKLIPGYYWANFLEIVTTETGQFVELVSISIRGNAKPVQVREKVYSFDY